MCPISHHSGHDNATLCPSPQTFVWTADFSEHRRMTRKGYITITQHLLVLFIVLKSPLALNANPLGRQKDPRSEKKDQKGKDLKDQECRVKLA